MSGPVASILWPLLAQVGLVFVLYAWLSMARRQAVKRGEVEQTSFVLGRGEPIELARISPNLANQFELPVIFYAAVALLVALDRVTSVDVVAAWIFVAGRVVHALVQTLTDNIVLRGQAFMVSGGGGVDRPCGAVGPERLRLIDSHASALRCPGGRGSQGKQHCFRRCRPPDYAPATEREMTIQAVLLPLFVQVVLTFVLLFWTGGVRAAAVRRGDVHPRNVALREPNWPKQETQIANAYQNQLELPVLFYVLTILAIMTRQADMLFVMLAWTFVILRLVHAYVHITSNRLGVRFLAFSAGSLVLAVTWAIFMLRILLELG
jgi:hypothetical protein